MRAHLATLFVAASLSVGTTGCIREFLTDGQIAGARLANTSFDTISDLEIARTGVEAAFGNFEALHELAPYNADQLFLLMKTWGGYGSGFISDDIEAAHDAGNDALEDYQRRRAAAAFNRAIFYGLELIGQTSTGFDEAKQKGEGGLAKWLATNFTKKEDGAPLALLGLAWIQRIDVMKGYEEEGPPLVAEMWVAQELMERANILDAPAEHYTAPIVLAAVHARSSLGELDQSKRMFDQLMATVHGKNLIVPVSYATTYACTKGDGVLYQSLLSKALSAEDPDPFERLQNAISKRKAKRWLSPRRAKEMCGIDLNALGSTNKSAMASLK